MCFTQSSLCGGWGDLKHTELPVFENVPHWGTTGLITSNGVCVAHPAQSPSPVAACVPNAMTVSFLNRTEAAGPSLFGADSVTGVYLCT